MKEEEKGSWYKWEQRLQAQLTRLCNNHSDHIVLLILYNWDVDWWLEFVADMPSSWKQPTIHVFTCVLTPVMQSLNHSNMP